MLVRVFNRHNGRVDHRADTDGDPSRVHVVRPDAEELAPVPNCVIITHALLAGLDKISE